jgi:hypothetical protein
MPQASQMTDYSMTEVVVFGLPGQQDCGCFMTEAVIMVRHVQNALCGLSGQHVSAHRGLQANKPQPRWLLFRSCCFHDVCCS